MESSSHSSSPLPWILSFVVHGILWILLTYFPSKPLEEVPVVTVSLEPPPPISRKQERAPQITSPSERPSEEAPKNPSVQSDTNAQTEREQLKRGLPQAGVPGSAQESRPEPQKPQQPQEAKVAPPPKKAPPQEKKEEPKEAQKKAAAEPLPKEKVPQVKDLFLDQQTVAKNFTKESSKPAPSSAQAPRAGYRAFSRPPGSKAQFLGTSGVPDYLPHLPDGDITLLNAKANKYAVFVRRVASQVFSRLQSLGWQNLTPDEVQTIQDFSTIRATLSLKGELLEVSLEGRSGSSGFDSITLRAAELGAQDRNPPPGAEAEDGKIHFIFQARSWVQFGVNPRNNAPIEQRWLLLGTGLE